MRRFRVTDPSNSHHTKVGTLIEETVILRFENRYSLEFDRKDVMELDEDDSEPSDFMRSFLREALGLPKDADLHTIARVLEGKTV